MHEENRTSLHEDGQFQPMCEENNPCPLREAGQDNGEYGRVEIPPDVFPYPREVEDCAGGVGVW